MNWLFLADDSASNDPLQTIGERLVPSWLSLVVQLTSFIILLLVVFFFAYKPVKRLLKERADHVENEIQEAAENKASALKENETAKINVANSKLEASQIIQNAEKSGQEKYDALINKAEQDIKEMKAQADKDIAQAKQDALNDIKNAMVDIALDASKEILKREVDSQDNEQLAQDFINHLN